MIVPLSAHDSLLCSIQFKERKRLETPLALGLGISGLSWSTGLGLSGM